MSSDENQFDDTYDELPLRQSTAVDDDYDLPQTHQVPTIMEDDYDLPRPSCKSNVCVTDDEDEYDVPQSSHLDFDVSFLVNQKLWVLIETGTHAWHSCSMHYKCSRAHL